jgi:hypothetical protein
MMVQADVPGRWFSAAGKGWVAGGVVSGRLGVLVVFEVLVVHAVARSITGRASFAARRITHSSWHRASFAVRA